MGQSYFIWKGRDCRSMGVRLQGALPIIRPEERVEHVQIPGRSGDMTEIEGYDIYNSYIQTATILVPGGLHVRDVFSWLRGDDYVTFSGEPDRRQKARIIGAITLNKHSYNADWWTGEVQFYCQPLKEKLHTTTVTITSSGDSVYNFGDVQSKPRIMAKASGTSMSISDGLNTLSIKGLTANNEYVIDSDIMEITDSMETTLLTKNSSGAFPLLVPGRTDITGSGWSRLVIDKRERFL